MLDRIAPEQFDKWVAFRRIEKDPDERLRQILCRGFAALAQSFGNHDITPEYFDPDPEESAEMSPKAALAALKSQATQSGQE